MLTSIVKRSRAETKSHVTKLTGILLILLFVSVLSAESIVRAEYFLNNDPGLGNGVSIPVQSITGDAYTYHSEININNLNPGFHRLLVRAKDSSGKWTQTSQRSFMFITSESVLANIVKAEYVLDNDPGLGQGVNIPIQTITGDSYKYHAIVDINSLNAGIHRLLVRAKNTAGKWTLTSQSLFIKIAIEPVLPNIVKAEYFLDNDPGYGNGTNIPLQSGGSSTQSLSFTKDISNLSEGFHHIFIRVKDAKGCWTITQNRAFFKAQTESGNPNIVAAEYFIDTDPGLGFGTTIPVSPGTTSTKNLDLAVSINNLNAGFHSICVRVKDTKGKWTQTYNRRFYFEENLPVPQVCKAEYFFDTDPGIGRGIPITVSPDTSLIVSFTASIQNLTEGNHNIFVRVKSDEWSQTFAKAFTGGATIEPPAQVTGVHINIVNYDAIISWNPVTQSIYGHPCSPDAYLVLYSENPSDSANYYYLNYTHNNSITHTGVTRFRTSMFYKVIAVKYPQGSYLTYLRKLSKSKKQITWPELKRNINTLYELDGGIKKIK